LEVPGDHSIPVGHTEPKKGILEIMAYPRERESEIKDNQLTNITRWAHLAPALRTVIFHPESPIMSSFARNSVIHGTGKYEALIIEWSIRRDGTAMDIIPLQ
jgi:hypothetical protein